MLGILEAMVAEPGLLPPLGGARLIDFSRHGNVLFNITTFVFRIYGSNP
jgi:hypothetical protein